MSATPKGYWIGHVTVDDVQSYQAYREANAAVFEKYGARFLVRGGAMEVVEGDLRPRTVVIEFPSLAAARECYLSAEYQHVLMLRTPVSEADLCIVEGYSA